MRRLSIAGLYFGTVVEAISKFARIMEYLEKTYPNHYEHIHLLGIFNIKVILPLIWLVKKKYPHIKFTSDSSTWLKRAIRITYLKQFSLNKAITSMPVGVTDYPEYKTSSPFSQLSCSCPICRNLKYSDIFTYNQGFTVFFLAWHNVFESIRYNNLMNDLATKISFEDYRNLSIRHILNHRKDSAESKAAFGFVHELVDKNLEYATRRYSHWISMKGLMFGTHKSVSTWNKEEEGLQEISAIRANYAHQEAIIGKYETDFKGSTTKNSKFKKSKLKSSFQNKSIKKRKSSLSKSSLLKKKGKKNAKVPHKT
jgi:hypothetical protein